MDRLDVRIRPLRAKDLDRVVELERELFGPGAWTYGMLVDELAGLGRWYIAAEPVVPFVAGPQPPAGYGGLWFDGEVTQIMTIGVASEYQHHGIGSALLNAMIERSLDLGARAVLLEVRVDNAAALGMYDKYGFKTLRVRKRYYQPEDVDAYTMSLDLAPLRCARAPIEDDVEDPAAGASQAAVEDPVSGASGVSA